MIMILLVVDIGQLCLLCAATKFLVRLRSQLCGYRPRLCGSGQVVPVQVVHVLLCGSCGYVPQWCGYVHRLCGYVQSFLRFSESAPLVLKAYTPAYVQASLDALQGNALYTQKLVLKRALPKQPEDPAAGTSKEPTHATRGASAPPPDPVNLVKEHMGYSSHIRGKTPPAFKQAEFLRGPAKEFSLANVQVLAQLTAYLYLNGKYDLVSTPKDGSCLFSSVKWGCDMPTEFVTPLFRRQLVVFLAENAGFFFNELEVHIKGNYGGIRLTREEYLRKTHDGTITPAEEYDYCHPGPFSYAEYLEYLLKDATWGDEVLIVTMSMMWQITITVVHDDCRESRVRHDRPLEDVDLVIVYCGSNHYVGAGKDHIYFYCLFVCMSFCAVCAAPDLGRAATCVSCAAPAYGAFGSLCP